MRHFRACTALAVALVGGLGTAAQATTIQTGPSPAFHWNDSVVYCGIRNVGMSPLTVKVEGISGFGAGVVNDLEVTLAPQEGTSLPSSFAHLCRFTFNGSAKSVRAAAIYFDGFQYTAALPAR
jgi:hypothetical protein